MRKTLDANNDELKAVLDELIAEDVAVTLREVARRHPTLKNASNFTRNMVRSTLIEQAQTRQADARHVRVAPMEAKAATLAEQLAEKAGRVKVLEAQVQALVTSHAACVKAVMQHGGMQALQRFWWDYSDLADRLKELDAIPPGAQIVALSGQKDAGTTRK